MGNCNQICRNNPAPVETHMPEGLKTSQHPSQIHAEQFTLRCQICGQEKKHTILKNHLDICHFVSVQQKNTELQAMCLLCNFKSISLDQFKTHLQSRHQYMQSQSYKNLQQQRRNCKKQTNESLRNRVKAIPKTQFQKNKDRKVAKIQGQQYNYTSHQKQYGALEFDQQRAIGDVVWRYIFSQQNMASFYSIQFKAQQKSILAISKIFTKIAPNL